MCAFMQVLECRLVVDPRTRESRGFGFVTMSSTKEADRCIKYLHRSTLEGRVITVEKVSGTIRVMLVNWCCLHDFLPHKPVLLCFLSSTKALIKFQCSLGHVGKGSALWLVCKPRIPLHYICEEEQGYAVHHGSLDLLSARSCCHNSLAGHRDQAFWTQLLSPTFQLT